VPMYTFGTQSRESEVLATRRGPSPVEWGTGQAPSDLIIYVVVSKYSIILLLCILLIYLCCYTGR